MSRKHRWTEDDEIVGFYLYRFGDKHLDFSKEQLAELMGMGWNSMSLKVANFKAVDGKGGMEGFSEQCRAIYERYKDMPDDDFQRVGVQAMQRVIQRRLDETKG